SGTPAPDGPGRRAGVVLVGGLLGHAPRLPAAGCTIPARRFPTWVRSTFSGGVQGTQVGRGRDLGAVVLLLWCSGHPGGAGSCPGSGRASLVVFGAPRWGGARGHGGGVPLF